ncbi:SPOR domain-containing protein [Marinomonas algicola]|uniref:SPOR domain-containing protein n=1 Tax=Marinomonas algicola TaxID=2773454 RepID=UPI00174E6FE0|nr:AAA family ATPase [Marinomonas algicola]
MAEPNFQFDLESALDQQPRGVLRDPFGSNNTPYFTTEVRNQQLAMLEHLSRYSSMLLVVEGEQGSGKTAFMKEFAVHQTESAVISQVYGSMLMTAGQLLSAIYSGFDRALDHLSPDSTFGPLLAYAKEQEQTGLVALIMIDNAQELNTDAIIMLLDMVSMSSEHQAVPHVLLFSEYPLQRNLDTFQKNRFEQLSHHQVLQPFTLEETRAYLLHRVRSVSGEINLPFTDKQVRGIFKESKGLPGRINHVAQSQLGIGTASAANSKAKFKMNFALGFPMVHMVLLSLIMFGILITVVFSGSDDEKASNVTGRSIALEGNAISQNTSPTIAKIEEMQKRLGRAENTLSLPPIPDDVILKDNATDRSQREGTSNGGIVAAPIKLNEPAPLAPIPLEPTNVGVPRVQSPVLQTSPVVQNGSSTLSNNAEKTPIEEPSDRFEKTSWWLTQSPNRYSLQLLGTYNLKTVKEFIRDQGSLDGFSYFQAVHNNRDWFVVVYGNYRNRSEAIAAVETLPRELQSLNPWARSVRGIQQDIRKAQ